MRNGKRLSLAGIAIIGLVAVCSAYMHWRRSPILIGFAGQLTGKQAELGVQERNGVLLAVDECNAAGGINGRAISLIVQDDLGTPEKAKEVDQALIEKGVVALIGHPTTAQSLAGMAVTNPARVVMISPTVSSPKVSGIDDFFFRVYPSFKDSASAFARYISQEARVVRLGILVDTDNSGYTQVYSDTFKEQYISLQGKIVEEITFSSKAQPDFKPLLEQVRGNGIDGLLILASDIDTALIAQRAQGMDRSIKLFTSAWAQTATLIHNGGQAVEGMKLEQSYAPTNPSTKFLAFISRFENRFGNPPSFGAAFGYEAAQVLMEALKQTQGKPEGLKDALLATKNFPGLTDAFSLDRFGDVIRPFYLSEIKNGRFVVLKKLTSPAAGSL
jgi:branched-chain amino acid transport system substrate-binding protein